MTVIKYIDFVRPVPIGSGQTIQYWAIAAHGRTIRIEPHSEGLRLCMGKRGAESWEPAGDSVVVPWGNIASILESNVESPDPDPVNLRGRTRTARE